jgi:hypothetical protein
MTLEQQVSQQISQQRVKHLVSSYQLDADEQDPCTTCLVELFQAYPTTLIELAIVESLVQNWLTLPMPRGMKFFQQVQDLLRSWQTESIQVSFTPDEFQQITGLDPYPVFGYSEVQRSSIVRPC